MLDIFDWLRVNGEDLLHPWLIIGKGPTFEKLRGLDLAPYRKLSLNHAVRELKVDLAHIIDIDVVDACSDCLEKNARAVVMPWHPHVNQQFDRRTLDQWADEKPVLKRLREQGRLLWYNLARDEAEIRPNSPLIEVRFFSGEAALNLLATAGVRVVRSLGVDGGNSYSGNFADIAKSTLLANGRPSFDRQFDRMAGIILRTGIDFSPIDVESPIRVYVACSESELLPVRVLEYSIRKRTSMSVKVYPLCHASVEYMLPRDVRNQPRTPFSFQRFLIPEIAGRHGHAIYLDADMQVFRDLRTLWMTPMESADFLSVRQRESARRPQFSVMLLDCAKLEWDIRKIVARLDRDEVSYEQLMYEMRGCGIYNQTLPDFWNHLEFFDPAATGLLHFTDMTKQPWVCTQNPLGYLWCRDLLEAIEAGAITREFIGDHIDRGFIRPSLLVQIDEKADDPLLLSRRMLALDEAFQAPYTRLSSQRASLSMRTKALFRHWYNGSFAQNKIRKLQERR